MRRRHTLRTIVSLLGAGVVAGCSAEPGSTPTRAPTSTLTSTPSSPPPSSPSTSPPSTATSVEGPGLVVDGPGPFPHGIVVDNSLDRAVTLTLTVDTADGTRLYRRTHTVDPRTERVVAGFTELTASSDRQSVRVTVVLAGGDTESIEFRVDDCHGDVVVFFDDTGDVQLTYSVC